MPSGIALLFSGVLQRAGPPPSTRAGNITMARSSENTPSTAMPSNRNGSEISHTIGHNNSARMASGQHTTSNRHHKRNLIID